MAGFDSRVGCDRAGGRNGWFCGVSGLSEVACDGLAVDPQFARDPTLGQALAVQGQDNVYHGHFEQIRHGAAPEKGGYPGA